MEKQTQITPENLSPAEKEMIRLQREADANKEAQRAAEQKIRDEKRIKEEQANIAKFQSFWARQNAAAIRYFNDLHDIDARFELKEDKKTKVFEVSDGWGQDRKIIWSSEEIPYNQITIKHTALHNKEIGIEEHETSSNYRTTNHGFKMKLYGDNRYTKDPKNMAEKFLSVLREIDYNKKQLNIEEENKKEAAEQLKAKYPDATVTLMKEWQSGYNYGHGQRREGKDVFFFHVIFNNGYGIKVNYGRYDNKLWLHYGSIIYKEGVKNDLDAMDSFVNAIKNIK